MADFQNQMFASGLKILSGNRNAACPSAVEVGPQCKAQKTWGPLASPQIFIKRESAFVARPARERTGRPTLQASSSSSSSSITTNRVTILSLSGKLVLAPMLFLGPLQVVLRQVSKLVPQQLQDKP